MGCSSKDSDSVPILYQETIGNYTYEIKVNQDEFSLNDKIKVFAKVKNNGNETLSYFSRSSSCPIPLWVEIFNRDSKKSLVPVTKTRSLCTTDGHMSDLKPNQSVEAEWEFKPKYEKNNATRGIYDVKVSLPSPSVFVAVDKKYPSAKISIIIN